LTKEWAFFYSSSPSSSFPKNRTGSTAHTKGNFTVFNRELKSNSLQRNTLTSLGGTLLIPFDSHTFSTFSSFSPEEIKFTLELCVGQGTLWAWTIARPKKRCQAGSTVPKASVLSISKMGL
jgi:hypothetical protein